MRSIDPDKHAAQRQAILNAARRCFCENGFHRTTTDALCASAGTSSGKLFYYFPNKKALILAVVEDQCERMRAWIAELSADQDPAAALMAAVDGILLAAGNPAERRLVLEIAAEASRDAGVAEAGAQGDRVLAQGLASLLSAATQRGLARPLIAREYAVCLLMVLIDGIFSRASTDGDFDPATARTAFKAAIRTLLGMEEEGRR